jgi:hypothetical protein
METMKSAAESLASQVEEVQRWAQAMVAHTADNDAHGSPSSPAAALVNLPKCSSKVPATSKFCPNANRPHAAPLNHQMPKLRQIYTCQLQVLL